MICAPERGATVIALVGKYEQCQQEACWTRDLSSRGVLRVLIQGREELMRGGWDRRWTGGGDTHRAGRPSYAQPAQIH